MLQFNESQNFNYTVTRTTNMQKTGELFHQYEHKLYQQHLTKY